MEDLKNIVESLLFVSEEPISLKQFKSIIPGPETSEIRDALTTLADDYQARASSFYLSQVAGGYQLRTRPVYAQWIKRLVQPRPQRLSKAALETLAIVAYKQPVLRSDIEYIRGVDCGGVLRALLERKLVRVLGRKEIPGRPLIYATTKLFLEIFGLKDLRDLPTPKEIADLNDTPEEKDTTLLMSQMELPTPAEEPATVTQNSTDDSTEISTDDSTENSSTIDENT